MIIKLMFIVRNLRNTASIKKKIKIFSNATKMQPMLLFLWNFSQSKCPTFCKLFSLSFGNAFLFLTQGCSWSVIFVDLDAHNRNRQTLCSLLPRESRSHVRHFYPKLTCAVTRGRYCRWTLMCP